MSSFFTANQVCTVPIHFIGQQDYHIYIYKIGKSVTLSRKPCCRQLDQVLTLTAGLLATAELSCCVGDTAGESVLVRGVELQHIWDHLTYGAGKTDAAREGQGLQSCMRWVHVAYTSCVLSPNIPDFESL